MLAVAVVTGSRNLAEADHRDLLWVTLDDWRRVLFDRPGPPPRLVVLHGDCKVGADLFADQWGIARGAHVLRVPALWRLHGRSAGPKRNAALVDLARTLQCGGAHVCAFTLWDGESRGTADCRDRLRRALGAQHVSDLVQPASTEPQLLPFGWTDDR